MRCNQEAKEPAYAFLKIIRQIIKQCEYDPIVEESNLMDLFIFRMYLKLTQKSLLNEGKDLTIAMALHIAKVEETTKIEVEVFHIPEKKVNAHAVQANHDLQTLW